MGRPSKIPERLEGEILAQAGRGLGTRQIAEWLASAHKIEVGHTAVARLLNRLREDRRTIAQAVVREEIAPRLTADIQILARHVSKLDRLANALSVGMLNDNGDPGEGLTELVGQTPRVKLYGDMVGRIEHAVETMLKFSGAGSDGDVAQPVIMIPPESED